MLKRVHIYEIMLFVSFWMVLLASCAQIGVPEGGPPDEDPPELIVEESTPNRQTNFQERKFTFQFNEWIKIQNATKEVFISPPLAYPPKIEERGKKVIFEFAKEEELKENTTYQINFGNAIKDITEGLPFENFVFLFSTGDKIDSLSLGGKVIDSQTGKGSKNIVVMLYDNLSDTCFYSVKPLYLTRTDDDGVFKLENLRSDTFQIYALKDDNVSYTYDLPTEQVAYSDSLIFLTDTTLNNLELLLFDEEDEPRLVEATQKATGLIKLQYIPKPFYPKLNMLDSFPYKYFMEESNDTLMIWHDAMEKDSILFAIQYDESIDTVNIRPGRKNISELALSNVTNSISINPEDTIYLEFNKPIDSLDNSKIVLSDSSGVIEVNEFGVDKRSIWMLASLKPKFQYEIKLDSASVSDWYQKTNKDSITIKIETIDTESLGNIIVDFANTDSLSYIVEMRKGDKVIQTLFIDEDKSQTIEKLSSGNYSFKITQDLNKDKRWTSGSIKEKRRSEIIKEIELEELKAGWDLQATVDFQELFYGTEIE